MQHESTGSAAAAYGVFIDPSGSRRESLGPLFVRLSVTLSGPVDACWRRSYDAITSETDRFSRFTLDKRAAVIQFTCRAAEGAAEINNLIQRLELLLELTNLHSTLRATSQVRKSA